MLASPQVPARSKSFKHTYTLAEVDEQLTTISMLLNYSENVDRKKAFVEANRWLDRRLELMN